MMKRCQLCTIPELRELHSFKVSTKIYATSDRSEKEKVTVLGSELEIEQINELITCDTMTSGGLHVLSR